jgi:hypothetical protein
MSQHETMSLCEALKSVPVRWRAEFIRLLEEGEAGGDFLSFLEQDEKCRLACEAVLRADEATAQLIRGAFAQSGHPTELPALPSSGASS